jgi:hypothetical protein
VVTEVEKAMARLNSKSFPISYAVCSKTFVLRGSPWPSQKRVHWLEAAARCFDLMYTGDDGKISVTVKKDV